MRGREKARVTSRFVCKSLIDFISTHFFVLDNNNNLNCLRNVFLFRRIIIIQNNGNGRWRKDRMMIVKCIRYNAIKEGTETKTTFNYYYLIMLIYFVTIPEWKWRRREWKDYILQSFNYPFVVQFGGLLYLWKMWKLNYLV